MERRHLPGGAAPGLIGAGAVVPDGCSDHDHQVDAQGEVIPGWSDESDAEVLAGLRGRRGVVPGVLAPLWAVLAAAQLAQGNGWLGLGYVLVALGWTWMWWVSPQPHVRAVTADALLVRRGLRTRSILRAELQEVRPKHLGDYGLALTLRDADRVELPGTAPRFSVAAAQAAALRRWAGLDGGPPVS